MGWVFDSTFRPLYPQERELVPIVQEVGEDPGPAQMGTENLARTGI